MTVQATWLQLPTLAPGDEQEVVGEARCQDVLEELAQGRAENGCGVRHFTAELVREPDNPFDCDAVRIDIGGKQVGYIPADFATDFHEIIDHLWSHGSAATCRATLIGGWVRGPRDRGHIGVALDISQPLTTAPDGIPMIPWGPRVTVTCEAHYQSPLEALLGPVERKEVVALLADQSDNPHKSGNGGAVQVLINGAAVGYLTPAMSLRYTPIVELLASQAPLSTCYGSLKRTEKQIEVRLQMPRPEHLGL